MKARLLFGTLALVLALAVASQAQNFTTVTGRVYDPTRIPYAFGSITFVLGPLPFAATPTLPTTPATPVAGTIGPFGLAADGSFSIILPSNAAITPGSTQWTARVCAQQGAGHLDQPIVGNCFTAAAVTISGTSQDITATLEAAALPLTQKADIAKLFGLLPAAGSAGIGPVTMVTAPTIPTTGTTYRFGVYLTQTAAGTGCTTNTTIAVQLIFLDPNESSAAPLTVASYTIVTNGAVGRMFPASATEFISFPIRVKAGNAMQYQTTFTGGSCSTLPVVQVYPVLEQM